MELNIIFKINNNIYKHLIALIIDECVNVISNEYINTLLNTKNNKNLVIENNVYRSKIEFDIEHENRNINNLFEFINYIFLD